jgi:UDPglucose 6-dehydrogenase
MNICVVGCGYVGLVTAACLAHIGHRVTGVDVDEDKVAALTVGQLHIYEPGLRELVQQNLLADRLAFHCRPARAVESASAIFICVGTPPKPSGDADTSQVEAAVRAMGGYLNRGYKVVVNKSTVPIGSANWVATLIAEAAGAKQGVSFDVVSNPEFLREGSAIADTLHPDRIVVGTDSPAALEVMRRLYAPIVEQRFPHGDPCPAGRGSPHWMETDPTSAEVIKYASNAFLATKISFINEIANVCEAVGANVKEVSRGMGLDPRIGPQFLSAGLGWGGSCFRKDVSALAYIAREYGCTTRILDATLAVNEDQRARVVRKLQGELQILKGKTITLFGLSFKPNTDDCRDSPALAIAKRLLELGCKVKAHDPRAEAVAAQEVPAILMADDPIGAATDADAVVLATEWPELVGLDYRQVASVMRGRLVVDARNALDPRKLAAAGLKLVGMGR